MVIKVIRVLIVTRVIMAIRVIMITSVKSCDAKKEMSENVGRGGEKIKASEMLVAPRISEYFLKY